MFEKYTFSEKNSLEKVAKRKYTTLDFEEFLWANDIGESIINMLKKCLEEAKPVLEAIHNKMRQLLLQYTVVDGMPDVVQTFVNTKQINLGQ